MDTYTTDYTKHFCSSGCRECYQEDRKHGLIYGLAMVKDDKGNESITGWYDACYIVGACAYCQSPIASQKQIANRLAKYFSA